MQYEFECRNCGDNFTLILSLAERREKELTCPKCKSREIEQRMSDFYAKTARKAA